MIIESIEEIKHTFPYRITLKGLDPMPKAEWCTSNYGTVNDTGSWTWFVRFDEKEQCFMFKVAAHAMAFRLIFGGTIEDCGDISGEAQAELP